MNITAELAPMLDSEDRFVSDLKDKLAVYGESITDKAEHDLRMGYRTQRLIEIKLERLVEGRA